MGWTKLISATILGTNIHLSYTHQQCAGGGGRGSDDFALFWVTCIILHISHKFPEVEQHDEILPNIIQLMQICRFKVELSVGPVVLMPGNELSLVMNEPD